MSNTKLKKKKASEAPLAAEKCKTAAICGFCGQHKHLRMFGLTLIGIVLINYFLLNYAYISFFCFFAAVGTIHLIYIILGDKCCLKHRLVPSGGNYEKR